MLYLINCDLRKDVFTMKKVNSMIIKAKNAMAAKRGEAYIDMVVKIVIVAVLGVIVFGVVKGIVGKDGEGFLGKAQTKINEITID